LLLAAGGDAAELLASFRPEAEYVKISSNLAALRLLRARGTATADQVHHGQARKNGSGLPDETNALAQHHVNLPEGSSGASCHVAVTTAAPAFDAAIVSDVRACCAVVAPDATISPARARQILEHDGLHTTASRRPAVSSMVVS